MKIKLLTLTIFTFLCTTYFHHSNKCAAVPTGHDPARKAICDKYKADISKKIDDVFGQILTLLKTSRHEWETFKRENAHIVALDEEAENKREKAYRSSSFISSEAQQEIQNLLELFKLNKIKTWINSSRELASARANYLTVSERIEQLNKKQRAAIIAHEISHLLHREYEENQLLIKLAEQKKLFYQRSLTQQLSNLHEQRADIFASLIGREYAEGVLEELASPLAASHNISWTIEMRRELIRAILRDCYGVTPADTLTTAIHNGNKDGVKATIPAVIVTPAMIAEARKLETETKEKIKNYEEIIQLLQ
jgi:hypothetical protein